MTKFTLNLLAMTMITAMLLSIPLAYILSPAGLVLWAIGLVAGVILTVKFVESLIA